jgi:hypothetical protein
MPYALKKVAGGYVVVTQGTGKKHSKKPLSARAAKAQMAAMYAAMDKGKKHDTYLK